jgi:branched-chain amino acid transport system permease protein
MNIADARSALEARGAIGRMAVIAAFLGVVVFLIPAVLGADWIKTLTSVAIYAVVAAGLVTLYGRVGMISLGQIALLAVGTWTATRVSFAYDIPFPLLLLITGAITCVVGVLIGLPALRLSGLYLALITLMAAGAVNVVLTTINFPNGGHGFTGHTSTPNLSGLAPVSRPGMAEGDTAYYRYTIVICAILFLLIALHFASKPGRAWAAIRESEPAALAAGVNIVRYKLWAFALASFTTGIAGGLLAAQLGNPTAFGFPTQDSLTLLAAALIGGIYSLWGAVIAGAFSQLAPFLFQAQWGIDPNFLLIIFGVGLLQVLLTAPRGIVVQMPKDIQNLGKLGLRLYRKTSGARRTA